VVVQVSLDSEKTVVVGMSGGVDSAVAALRLLQQGYRVIGATMKIWDGARPVAGPGGRHGCYGPDEEQDVEDARAVAGALGIGFHVVDLAADYRRSVLDHVVAEYRCGRTPNP
jgi:tRNA-uridine 2-sulfurtransferase